MTFNNYIDNKITRRNFLNKLLLSFVAILFLPKVFRLLNKDKKIAFANLNMRPKVVRVYDKDAVVWDYKEEKYLNFINQEVVDKMVEKGVCVLTEKNTPDKAWEIIMTEYRPGDKVAIKPNFNNVHHGYKDLFTSPQVISSVIKGLVEYVGVPEGDIYIYDLCRPIPYENVRNRINYEVNFVDLFEPKTIIEKIKLRLGLGLQCSDYSAPVEMSNEIIDEKGRGVTCYMPKVLTQAEHLINIPIFTNHIFISSSGPLKNHFGTVRFSDYASGPGYLHGKGIEQSIVDINLNYHIINKTRLIIADGLIGIYGRGELNSIKKWNTFPSEDGIPNSLFFAKDPLAVESVVNDYIEEERRFHKFNILSHEHLHQGMEKGIGIHEHKNKAWNYEKIKYIEL